MSQVNARASAGEDLEKQAVGRGNATDGQARPGRRRPSLFAPKGQQFPLFHAWRP